jgi:hypothetical protein
MIKYIFSFLITVFLFSCVPLGEIPESSFLTEEEMMAADYPEKPAPTPLSSHLYRTEGVLNIEFAIPSEDWDYSSHLDDSGLVYTLVIKGVKAPLGKINLIRPAIGLKTREYPSGHKIEITLANKSRLEAVKTKIGLHVKLIAIEPDMEMLSMDMFGGWADPHLPAKTFYGVNSESKNTEIEFDNMPVYATGESGGRYYLDIFGVKIPYGAVKADNIAAVNRHENKTRLIFTKPFNICPEGKTLEIGRECKGYSSLYNFQREMNDRSESFLFMLPGRPPMEIKTMKGLVAFGFKDTTLFSKGLYRFDDGMVYKVEAREKDGLLWLVFLLNREAEFRKYYSGDQFFVVFYRGDK